MIIFYFFLLIPCAVCCSKLQAEQGVYFPEVNQNTHKSLFGSFFHLFRCGCSGFLLRLSAQRKASVNIIDGKNNNITNLGNGYVFLSTAGQIVSEGSVIHKLSMKGCTLLQMLTENEGTVMSRIDIIWRFSILGEYLSPVRITMLVRELRFVLQHTQCQIITCSGKGYLLLRQDNS